MLNKLTTYRKQSEQGFTLIELLVVIIIIGILAAIAIPIFMNQQKTAITAGMKADVHNTNLNIQEFLIKYPTATVFELSTKRKGEGDVEGAPPISDLYEVVVTDPNTTVSVWGNWKSYTIRAWNTSIDPDASLSVMGEHDIYYKSFEGKLTVQDSDLLPEEEE